MICQSHAEGVELAKCFVWWQMRIVQHTKKPGKTRGGTANAREPGPLLTIKITRHCLATATPTLESTHGAQEAA